MRSIRQTRAVVDRLLKVASAAAIVISVTSAAYSQNYITDFAKNNNIYTDLNQQFPNTGPGVPGSHTGTPNASFLFNPSASAVVAAGYAPNYVVGSNLVNNNVNFLLTSNSAGQDFEQIGDPGGGVYTGPASLTVTAGLNNTSEVYLLMSSYFDPNFNITFTGANGATETFYNAYTPDFNGGYIGGNLPYDYIGGPGPGTYDSQTVFRVQDIGGGSTGNSTTGNYDGPPYDPSNLGYDLTELTFNLDSDISSQELDSFTITAHGYETLLFGVTANGTPVGSSSVPDSASTLALLGGALTGLAALRRRFAR
jgi:hypothetical protein